MTAEIYGGKEAQKSEFVEVCNHTDIEQAIIESGAGSDSHASAKRRSVGERGEDCWLVAADDGSGLIFLRQQNSHWDRSKLKKRWNRTENVTTVPAHPARKAIGAACDVAVETYTGDTAEIGRVSGFRFPVSGIWRGHHGRGGSRRGGNGREGHGFSR